MRLVAKPSRMNTPISGLKVLMIKFEIINRASGIPRIVPATPPITANAIYFTINNVLYASESTPIAFIVPISFSSLLIVASRLKRMLIAIRMIREIPISTIKTLMIALIMALLDVLVFPSTTFVTLPSITCSVPSASSSRTIWIPQSRSPQSPENFLFSFTSYRSLF